MASPRPLGLGSRSGTPRRSLVPASPSSALVPMSVSKATPSRRGFGLFFDESDDDEDKDMKSQQSVKFSGDTSGFESLRQTEPIALATSQRSGVMGSRNRRATQSTPARQTPAKSARSTPYQTSTTSRALMRAKAGSAQKDEDPIMNESIFATSPSYTDERTPGSAGDSETDEDVPSRKQTPSKRLFQVVPPSSNTFTPRRGSIHEEEDEGDKTWGEWISNFIPESVKKPVAKVLANTPLPKKKGKDIFLKTPEQDINNLNMPGSFEKPAEKKKAHNFINPNFVAMDKHQTTPIPNPSGLFVYNHAANGTPSRESKGPAKSTTTTPSTRQITPAGTFRKPSNFISRMKGSSTKKSTSARYTPYGGRHTTPRKPSVKEVTPEEELRILEQRERDRKVQEAEDKYRRRETLRKLGKDVDEEDDDSAMTDSVSAPASPVKKGKAPATTIEDTADLNQSFTSTASTTPPSTPPKSASKMTPKTPKFMSPGGGAILFEPTPPPVAPDSPPKEWAFTSSMPSTSPFEADSDKENSVAVSPPPPPTMSHRQLPSTAPTPPPVPETTSNGLGITQPVGGFGIAPPPAQPVDRVRSMLDKHKPRVSSSLRESSTYAKENDDDTKENGPATASSSSNTSGMFKSAFGASKTFGAPAAAPAQPRLGGALREGSANAPAATVKVDIGAKVAQLPVRDLFNVLLFPKPIIPGGGNDITIKTALDGFWQPEWARGDLGVFGGVKVGGLRV